MKQLVILMMVAASAFAAETAPAEDLVTVPRSTVSTAGLEYAKQHPPVPTAPYAALKWVGVGKEIGEATRGALESVVDVSDKFSKTDVGHFTMAMVAWRIAGQQATDLTKYLLHIVLGLLIFPLGDIALYVIYRQLYLPKRRLIEYDTATKIKRYEYYTFKFTDNDNSEACAIVLIVAAALWNIAFMCAVF